MLQPGVFSTDALRVLNIHDDAMCFSVAAMQHNAEGHIGSTA